MNPSFRGLKALLFDFGGTLDADGLSWKDQFFPIYRRAGFSWARDQYEKYFYASDDDLTEKGLKSLPYSKTIHLQVSLALKAAGVADEKMTGKIAKAYLKMSTSNLRRNVPLLKKLKKKYRLGVVSNFYGNLPVIFREIGYDKIFDAVIDSNQVGWTKPDPKIFLAALKKLKCSPQEALFVGDSMRRDMLGAKGLGMRHIWVLNRLAESRQPCCPDDLTVRSVRELGGILL